MRDEGTASTFDLCSCTPGLIKGRAGLTESLSLAEYLASLWALDDHTGQRRCWLPLPDSGPGSSWPQLIAIPLATGLTASSRPSAPRATSACTGVRLGTGDGGRGVWLGVGSGMHAWAWSVSMDMLGVAGSA